jgi:hypothetical protein
MIRRRAKAAGIETRIGNHTFRATGIAGYLKDSGTLEVAQQIANMKSPRTTELYDRRNDEISLDEIERKSRPGPRNFTTEPKARSPLARLSGFNFNASGRMYFAAGAQPTRELLKRSEDRHSRIPSHQGALP